MTAPRLAYVGFDAPSELIAAAGFTPVRLSGALAGDLDDTLPANLSPRSKTLLSQLLDENAGFAGVAIAHGCAEDVQLFGVLRELDRTGRGVKFPACFIDLLHGPGPAVATYNLARLKAFRLWLETLVGRSVDEALLAKAIAQSNRQRRALGDLFGRRRTTPPTLSGANAVDLVAKLDAAPYDMRDSVIAVAQTTVQAPLPGARVLLTGSPHEGRALYDLIEGAGAVIVGEDHSGGDLWTLDSLDETLPPMKALALRPQQGVSNGPTGSTQRRVEALAARVEQLRPDAVIHLRIGGDEAAPWDLAATRVMLDARKVPLLALEVDAIPSPEAAASLQAQVAAFLTGAPVAAPTRAANSPASRARPPETAGRRSRKALACTQDFSSWQRQWFADLRVQAQDGPFAVVNADAPQEILRAMGVPYVVNQWWAAIVAAKQKSRDYASRLREAGYPTRVEAYSAQGLAAVLGGPDDDPPWGGLPTPDILALVTNSDAGPKLFEAWARETGAQRDVFERSVECRWSPPIEWWDDMPTRWAYSLEPERLDLMTAQLEEHAERLAALTGRPLDRARLVEVMRLVNEQEHYYRRTRDLVAATHPAPIGIADSMPATMTPQWHRGSPWGRDAARRFYEEVRDRAAAGDAACPNERLRLMWIGRGLWSDMGLYQRWEESHGAVFVWSMYLGLAADGYIREFEGEHDVMRALAARFLTMGDELRMPTWAGAWHVKEARLHGVHGAVAIDDADPLVLEALTRAGIPVCRVQTDNMAGIGPEGEAQVTAFIEGLAGGG